jgi:hypothetical protein
MSNPIIRSVTAPFSTLGYDPAYLTAIAGFEKIVMNTAGAVPTNTRAIYKKGKDFRGRSIKWRVMSGLDGGGQWDGHSVIPPAGMTTLWDITATQYFYANSFTVTWEEAEYDLYGIGNLRAGELGKSLSDMEEKLLMQFIINEGATGTSFWYGIEGKCMLSDTHLYGTGGANQDNLAPGGVSYTNIFNGCTAIYDQRDYQGRPLNLMPKKVCVHTSRVHEVREYLNWGQDKKYGEISNNRNTIADFDLEIVGLPYFTNSSGNNGFLILANEHKLYMSQRKGKTIETLPKQADHGIKTDGVFTMSTWLEGWEGTYGYIG